jgi:putative pre-16S rRNA nuclease
VSSSVDREPDRSVTVRALGLDLGRVRIGVAVSDSAGVLATPYGVVARANSDDTRESDHCRIAELVDQVGAERVVVGLPLSLDGGVGPAAAATLEEVEQLRARLGVPVEVHDERLTTVSASKSLQAAGTRRARRVVDEVAASVILQSWLDGARR